MRHVSSLAASLLISACASQPPPRSALAVNDPDLSGDIALCSAIYEISAATATSEGARASFKAQQARMDAITSATFGASAPRVNEPARRTVVKRLEKARSENAATGAAEVLANDQRYCAEVDKKLPPGSG